MIYLKKNEETQTAFIPKNGSYEGKLSYKEGYEVGKAEGIAEGKNNPYSTKGFFFENGEKEFIYPVRINRDTMLQISFLGGNTSDYVEISFYPMGNGCVLANQNDSNIVCAMRGDLLRVFIYNTLQFELPCKQEEWHTLRLYTDRVILDGEETYFNTPYTGGSVVCACVNRGGNGFYRGLIQYMKGVEGEAVMYYISNLDEDGFKRLRSDNGVSDWYENNFVPVWGAFPVMQAKVPLNSVFINVEGGNCPELTELNVSQNGRYEGAYNVVNVDVPDVNGSYDEGYNNGYNDGKAEGGGSCNLGSLDSDTNTIPHTDNFIYAYANEYGVDGWSYISIDYRPLRKEVAEQTKNKIVNELQTLNATENGIYTPPAISFLRLDDDDKYELFSPTDVNAFEIKFRVNGSDDTEFFSQEGNEYDFIGIKACPSTSYLYVNWFNKQIIISDVDFSKWHTLVVKMLDENASVILDGEVYNGYIENSSYESNENNINVYGNIDLEYLNFWNTWEEYNDGDIPFFYFKVSPEGLMRSYMGEEYILVENTGGGSAQYLEEKLFLGYSEVNVNVPTEGGSCNIEETRWAEPTPADVDGSGYLVYHKSEGYDGMDRVALNMNGYNALKYNEGYEAGKAEGGDCPELTELNVTENGTYEGAYNKVNVDVPTEGGSCNLTELNIEWQSDWNENNYYADKQGYDGYSYVHIDATTALKEKYDEGYNTAIANDANLTPAKVEKKFDTLALRTENIHDGDIIRDRTKLRGFYPDDVNIENHFISYTQHLNSIVICEQGEYTHPSVMTIENGALDWNKIEYFHSFTIHTFGENMTRDMGSNVRELHIHYDWLQITEGSINVCFEKGCFATSNLLNKIVFYAPYYINVEENAFEGVSSSGKVIVVGIDMSENRAKYDDLMAQLGDGWTLRFVNEYNE